MVGYSFAAYLVTFR